MDSQEEQDIATVLTTLMDCISLRAIKAQEEGGGATTQQVHDAMQRLGEKVGLEAGLL